MKNCIINNTLATGVYVRGNAKLVKLDSFKTSQTRKFSRN